MVTMSVGEAVTPHAKPTLTCDETGLLPVVAKPVMLERLSRLSKVTQLGAVYRVKRPLVSVEKLVSGDVAPIALYGRAHRE